MKHYTVDRLEQNSEIVFSLGNISADLLRISCSDFYTVFADGRVADFGPERTAKGFTRIKTVALKNPSRITVRVNHYGIPTFDADLQPFFIGLELLERGIVVADAADFKVTNNPKRISESCRYSPQRGFVERYDFRKTDDKKLLLSETVPPQPLRSANVFCEYGERVPEKTGEGIFSGFDEITNLDWLDLPRFKAFGTYDAVAELKKAACGEFRYIDYDFARDISGLIKAEIYSDKDGAKALLVFEEYIEKGRRVFGRSRCNDLMEVVLKKGENHIISALPYTFRYLTVIAAENCRCSGVSAISVQNDGAKKLQDYGDEKVNAVANAARNTFMQNAFDIFTDCPCRERAGWLCDSYFSGIAEKFFTGRRDIERNFLENYIVGKCVDIPEKMLPMCYPARHTDGLFIPNWAMWFVTELYEYRKDTEDAEILAAAKEKVLGIAEFFSRYENEYGLLENLPSWVFIEWSEAGSDEFVRGVSFPTNMLYAATLKRVGELYGEDKFTFKSENLVKVINQLSFDGKFYCDNAERRGGKLFVRRDHVSETCQYYALFFGITDDVGFKTKMKEDFSLPQKQNAGKIAKSAVFIGNFLRIFWLLEEKEFNRALKEIVGYFYDMAVLTGTIWEKYEPTASCNHGFASSLAYAIDECYKHKDE